MQYQPHSRLDYDMVKIVSVLSYMTILGWLVAALLYGNHKSALARFHLRQSLGLTLTTALLVLIPLVGWLLAIGVILAWFYSLYHAMQGHRYNLPLFGDFFQQHLDFIK